MGDLAPPLGIFSFSPSNFGSAWGGYLVTARPTRAAVGEWEQHFLMLPVAGRSRSVTEAVHTKVLMHRLGWDDSQVSAPGRFSDGWDIAVASLNTTTGQWTKLEDADLTGQLVTGDSHPWLVSDARPYLSMPLSVVPSAKGKDRSRRSDAEVFGRGLTTARTRSELPAREYDLDLELFAQTGEDQLRYLRAAAAAGEQMCLHLPLGDRICGVIDAPSFEHTEHLFMKAGFSLVETGRPPTVPLVAAECNVPCAAVLDGTADCITIADANALDPDSSAFTFMVVFAPSADEGSDWMLSKGNVGGAAGYGIGTTAIADQVQAVIQGASLTATLTATSSTYFDNDPRGHSFLCSSSGTAQRFVIDGTTVDTDTVTHGAVTNAVALVVGALNGGASAHCAGGAIAAVMWPRQLSTTEEIAACYWGRGYPGYRLPPGASVVMDLRDQRTWNGLGTVVKDLSGNRNHGSVVSAPPVRGFPWPLGHLERHG